MSAVSLGCSARKSLAMFPDMCQSKIGLLEVGPVRLIWDMWGHFQSRDFGGNKHLGLPLSDP